MKRFDLFSTTGLILLLALPLQAWSAVTTGSGSASNRNLSVGNTARITIDWQLGGKIPVPGQQILFSANGSLRSPTGAVLLTSATQLLRKFTTTVPAQPYTFGFRETLTIPQSVLFRAQKQGITRLLYRRDFTDLNGIKTVTIPLFLTSAAAGPLNVGRIELRFDDGSRIRIAGQGDDIRAQATLNFSGTGQLDAVWEVARPESSRGRPFFIPLRSLRQYLSASGSIVLRSPPLPSDTTGDYRLRLRIISPPAAFTIPELHYRIQQTHTTAAPPPAALLAVTAPAPRATLGPDTDFRWQAVPGASAYQLELYEHPLADNTASAIGASADATGRPLTGLLVPAGDHARLSLLARSYLSPGGTYHWRVIAIGADGRVLAVSDSRPIHVP